MTTEVNTTPKQFSVVLLEVLHNYFPGDAMLKIESNKRTREWHILMICKSIKFWSYYKLFPAALATASGKGISQHELAHIIAKDLSGFYLSGKTN